MSRVRSLLFLLLLLTLFSSTTATPATASGPADDAARDGAWQIAEDGRIPYLTGPSQGEPLEIALNYLNQNSRALGLAAADLTEYVVTDHYTSERSGTSHVYLRQQHNGIDVFNSHATINVARDGSVMNVRNLLVPRLHERVTLARPAIAARTAVERTAQEAGIALSAPLLPRASEQGVTREVLFAAPGIAAQDIPVKLSYFQTEDAGVRLAWHVELYTRDQQHYWRTLVDAESGAILWHEDLVIHENFDQQLEESTAYRQATGVAEVATAPRPAVRVPFAPDYVEPTATLERMTASSSYMVYAVPLIDPNDAEEQGMTANTGRVMVVDPHLLAPNASPCGWHDVTSSTPCTGSGNIETLDTTGNNVRAYLDRTAASAGPTIPPTDPVGRVWDHDIPDLAVPDTYGAASATHLFYMNNISHDVHYQYGFNEQSGNLQINNYGKGGAGSDPVLAEGQDGGGTNNANQLTLADGLPARMQMYLGANTGCNTSQEPDCLLRDGTFDNLVPLHEYGHSVSIRLTGGPATSCLSGEEQQGEGWSDWWGLTFTHDANVPYKDDGADPRGVGMWLFGQGLEGRGIRPFHYSTDMTVNPFTYNSIKSGGPHGTVSAPHGIGSVWATIIWEMYWALVDDYGFNPDIYDAGASEGNIIAMNVVMQGLKIQGCSPTFVISRNAILQADQTLYGGAHTCTIWRAFAKRGLGINASDGGSTGRNDGSEDFTLPPACQNVDPLRVSPPAANVCIPNNASYTVTVPTSTTFPDADAVALGVSGVPVGYSASFSSNPVNPPGSTQLTLTGSSGATAGSYDVTITGNDGSTSASTTAELNLFAGAPGTAPTLQVPGNGATDVIRQPVFSWTETSGATSYRIEIATDNAFNNIVHTATETGTVHFLPITLAADTTYYWRVTPLNPCGDGTTSSVFSFTTSTDVDSRTELHFDGNVNEGCTGNGNSDVAACTGPFLIPTADFVQDTVAESAKFTSEPALNGGGARNNIDPNWVWNLTEPTSLEGEMTIDFWASCAACGAIFSADWNVRVYADGTLKFLQRVGANPVLPHVPTLLQIKVNLTDQSALAARGVAGPIVANSAIVLQIDPVYVDSQQGTVIYYDSTQQCSPGNGVSTTGCDSTVRMPVVGPLGVTLANLDATAQQDAIEVVWETSSEEDVVGFHLFRSTSATERGEQLTRALIPAQVPGSNQGAAYSWLDETAERDVPYFYRLVAVDNQGSSQEFGPVSAQLSAPTALTMDDFGSSAPTPLPLIAGLLGLLGLALLRRRRA